MSSEAEIKQEAQLPAEEEVSRELEDSQLEEVAGGAGEETPLEQTLQEQPRHDEGGR